MADEQTYDDILPKPGFELDRRTTAVVITDPQRDFLSEGGVVWGVVGESVQANNTVANLEALLGAAQAAGLPVFISPHGMFKREGALTQEGFEGSGADWHEPLKPYLQRDDVIVASPHKVYGPETNDLVLQLRKRGIDKVILAGMSANLCVEAHMRELLEQGFEVEVVKDATAGAILPGADAYAGAVINFRMMASAVPTTEEVVAQLKG
jgi:nicotinamidase-related amidase